jgi:hypothetical protein
MNYVKKLGWEDMKWKIGESIICLNNVEKDNPGDFWVDKLTIGKSYEIVDLEWRFWDRVCVKTDYPKLINHGEFVPVEFFDTLAEKRDKTIEEVLKK